MKKVSRTMNTMATSMRVWLRSAAKYSGLNRVRSIVAMVLFAGHVGPWFDGFYQGKWEARMLVITAV